MTSVRVPRRGAGKRDGSKEFLRRSRFPRSAPERGAGLLDVALRALPLRMRALFGALGLAERRFRLRHASPLLLLALPVRGFRLWPPRCRGGRRQARPEFGRLARPIAPR